MNDRETARAQALALCIQALEQDQYLYAEQLQQIEQPWLVANELVQMIVLAVPDENRPQCAATLRHQLDRYI